MNKNSPPDTNQLVARLLEEDSRCCANPGCRAKLSVDNASPVFVFQPETNHTDNLLLLCASCFNNYRAKTIPQSAIQAWKVFEMAIGGSIHSKSMELRNGAIRNYPGLCRYFPDEHLIFPGIGGKIYLNIHESHMMLARALGIYEYDKTQTIKNRLKPGQTFIDIGANKGDFTLLAAQLVGRQGKVLSFEPEPDNFSWLKKSIELNKYQNVITYDVALGSSNQDVTLYLGQKSGWHSLVPPDQGGTVQDSITVTGSTLDSVLGTLGNKQVDMIKIDVEGAELEVLRGAQATLKYNPEIILLIDIHPHKGVNPADVCDLLRQHDLKIFDMPPPNDKITDIAPTLTEIVARRNA
jgi:FkbM family methyltransferase